MPSGYFVKETLEFFHNSLQTVPIRHFVKETLDHFHNSLSKVLSGHFVKETLEFFHNSLHNMPIKNLSHSLRLLLKSTPLMGVRNVIKNSLFSPNFLVTLITYELSSYSVRLHWANLHTPLPFLFYLYYFQNIKMRHPDLFGAVFGKRHL